MLVKHIITRCSSHAVSLLFCYSLYVTKATSLYVVEQSQCAAQCTSASTVRTTNASDISCFDQNYNTTGTGVTFKNCVSCELASDAYDPQTGQEDVGWALCESRGRLVRAWCLTLQSTCDIPSTTVSSSNRKATPRHLLISVKALVLI